MYHIHDTMIYIYIYYIYILYIYILYIYIYSNIIIKVGDMFGFLASYYIRRTQVAEFQRIPNLSSTGIHGDVAQEATEMQ